MRKFNVKGLRILIANYHWTLTEIDKIFDEMANGGYSNRKKVDGLKSWRDAIEIILYGSDECQYCIDCGIHLPKDNKMDLCENCESGYYKENY